jgi:hypothetical protein
VDHVAFPTLLPGITATTSPTDYFPLKQFQLQRFDGEAWVPFGPIRGPEWVMLFAIPATERAKKCAALRSCVLRDAPERRSSA